MKISSITSLLFLAASTHSCKALLRSTAKQNQRQAQASCTEITTLEDTVFNHYFTKCCFSSDCDEGKECRFTGYYLKCVPQDSSSFSPLCNNDRVPGLPGRCAIEDQSDRTELPCTEVYAIGTCSSNNECNGKCRVVPLGNYTICDDKDSFTGIYPEVCEATVDVDGNTNTNIPVPASDPVSVNTPVPVSDPVPIRNQEEIDCKSEITQAVKNHASSQCISNSDCFGSRCRVVSGLVSGVITELYTACDNGNNFVGLLPSLCEDMEGQPDSDDSSDVIIIPASTPVPISDPVSVSDPVPIRNQEELDCTSDITQAMTNHPQTQCISNSQCFGNRCRVVSMPISGVVTKLYMACDDGNSFVGYFPLVCEDNERQPDDGDSSNVTIIPVEPECIDTGSDSYIAADANPLTKCRSNDECSVGKCRLMSTFMDCDEGQAFDSLPGWLPVCGED